MRSPRRHFVRRQKRRSQCSLEKREIFQRSSYFIMNSREFAIISVVFCLKCACFGQDSSLAENGVSRQLVCIWETFSADCGRENKVVVIVEAFHGRMASVSRCSIDLGSGESPCLADVRLFAERRCAGRRRCSFKPIDDDLRYADGNCSLHAEKYLSVAYRCQEVYSADNETCLANRSLAVTSSSGYLSNAVSEESGKGLSRCPWRFQPREGQTVTLTLLDFGVWQDRGQRSRRHSCRIYAWIRHLQPNPHGAPASDIPICAGDERERFIQSTTSALEVFMTTQSNQSSANKVYFLIRFQTTVGCPEIVAPLPMGAEVERRSEGGGGGGGGRGRGGGEGGIRIYCIGDRQRFQDLKCESGRWTPETINLTCPTFSVDSSQPSSPASFSSSSSSYSEFSPTEVGSSGEPFKGDLLSSMSWEKYLVPGGLLFLAVVVVIIVVVMCRNRRIERNRKSQTQCKLIRSSSGCDVPYADNAYYSGQLLIGGIYDEIVDSNLPEIPERSESGTRINGTLRRLNDPPSPGGGGGGGRSRPEQDPDDPCSAAGPRPYPGQYTDPLTRDSTYLVPREEERSSTLPTTYHQTH